MPVELLDICPSCDEDALEITGVDLENQKWLYVCRACGVTGAIDKLEWVDAPAD